MSTVYPPTIHFRRYPAKTFKTNDETREGRSVLNHCQIVGFVAQEMIKRFPPEIRAEFFPEGSSFAAATHDIGKISPYFYEKIRQACTGPSGLQPLANVDPKEERSWGGHACVSEVAAKAMNAPEYVPEILGQHHGFSSPASLYKPDDPIFGGPDWQREREALVAELKASLDMDWPKVASEIHARVLAGLTSVADWIGSGEFFENPDNPWRENITRAVDAAGFIPPEFCSSLSFRQIFAFDPNPVQLQLINQIDAPGVYVLEAPMGLGKTEAALYAAYRMLESGRARGIYFALPTQLTSNKIYERFNEFLQGNENLQRRGILAGECKQRSLLLHGKAWLLETEMGEEGRPGGAWFNQSKRGLLAPFAVGTIDQALMAAMNVKHGFVRAFGLMGKVVILDEVHSYDAYTGTLLNALVKLLRSLHCTVIILSATLSRARREEMLGVPLTKNAYPLISGVVPTQTTAIEEAVDPGESRPFAIRMLDQEWLAITEALARAQAGQQVLWIENTVVEAQQRYLDLAARAHELGVACGLLHSRFTADHRQSIEDHWVNLFGKKGWEARPLQGRILVGTQILEQSLDIDADFLVSRFAPTDMLLQRLGRLWRHADARSAGPVTQIPRASSAVREAWIIAPLEEAIAAPISAFGSSAHVYSPYVLCRSLEVWRSHLSVMLPLDIRDLIEATYAPRSESGTMAKWLYELENGKHLRKGDNDLKRLAHSALAQGSGTVPDSMAQTRYSESDTSEVLLLRGLMSCPEEKATRLTLLNGERIYLPWQRDTLNRFEWRKLSALLTRQVVPVHEQDAPATDVDTLKKLSFHYCFYLGRDDCSVEESLLRVALVDETGTLQGIKGGRVHERHMLEYRDDLGYRVIKD